MKLIVGLGNPGKKYERTRHNFGFMVVDALARRWMIDLTREKFHAFFGDGMCGPERVVLLKPTTLMNRSGRAVAAAGQFFHLEHEDLLVVSDDLALPMGRLRIRSKGSAGSHNGLQDIIDRIGGDDFARLRLGIDPPVGDPSVYVLSRFIDSELPAVARATETAADAVEHWVHHGVEATMNRFNKKVNSIDDAASD